MDDAKACTEACVNGGDSYVLVIGDVVHPLEGNAEEIKPFAGQSAQVSGPWKETPSRWYALAPRASRRPAKGN